MIQSHLVIASGSSNSNSLRVVRSGAGLERVACVEGLEGVERVWSLDLGDGYVNTRFAKLTGSHSSLLLSTASSTSLLELTPEVQESDLASSIASVPTLAAAILPESTAMIHVTATAITLWEDLISGKSRAIWQAPGEITSAQIHQDHVVVSTVGGDVHVLKASSSSLERVSYVYLALIE